MTTMSASAAENGVARYGADDLKEFRSIIQGKLDEVKQTIVLLESTLLLDRDNGTDDTYRTQNIAEDGQLTMEREEAARIVARQRRFQQDLQLALARIEQGTYGVCRVTGRLIPRERLRAVPHATLCVEAKQGA